MTIPNEPTGGWGYAVHPDGSRVPLKAPPFRIPEDEREILLETPNLTLWTRRPTQKEK